MMNSPGLYPVSATNSRQHANNNVVRLRMANTSTEEGADRLDSTRVDLYSNLYLHLKPLFEGIRKASLNARGRMLDIGCGNKPYAPIFAGRVSEHLHCDVVRSNRDRVDILCPATEIPLPDSKREKPHGAIQP